MIKMRTYCVNCPEGYIEYSLPLIDDQTVTQTLSRWLAEAQSNRFGKEAVIGVVVNPQTFNALLEENKMAKATSFNGVLLFVSTIDSPDMALLLNPEIVPALLITEGMRLAKVDNTAQEIKDTELH